MLLFALGAHPAHSQNLNTASEADLDSIRGSGPAITARILAARQERPFSSWPDVIGRVRGIGPATAKSWAAQGVTVHQPTGNETQQVGVSPGAAETALPHNR